MPRPKKRSRIGKQNYANYALKRLTRPPSPSDNIGHQVTDSISQRNECLQLLLSKIAIEEESSEEDKEIGEEQEEPGFGYRKRSSTCEG